MGYRRNKTAVAYRGFIQKLIFDQLERQGEILRKKTFKRGIHPLHEIHQGKSLSEHCAIRPFVAETVCIPMDMHIGAPSAPCVKKGQLVKLGEVIAEPVGGIGIPVHASVSGKVTEVALRQQMQAKHSMCITIQNDFQDEWVELNAHEDPFACTPDEIIEAVKQAGICGMGGACFPTHVKMKLPEGKEVDTIILNGAECETFLTADHRLMLERPRLVINGLLLAMQAMDVQKGFIAIEDNKMDAIRAIKQEIRADEKVKVVILKAKYPQGGEKQLIDAVIAQQVPSGGLPMDAHCVVLNVGTAASIYEAVAMGKPLIERVTTVTGCVKQPDNLLLRIGTSFIDAINECGGYAKEPGKIFAGGSMTGICAPTDTVSAGKGNNGIVVLDQEEAKFAQTTACIRCGKCLDACPIGLNPMRLKDLCDRKDLDVAVNECVMDCMFCGSCSYVCPAHRWLMDSIKIGRNELNARRAR